MKATVTSKSGVIIIHGNGKTKKQLKEKIGKLMEEMNISNYSIKFEKLQHEYRRGCVKKFRMGKGEDS